VILLVKFQIALQAWQALPLASQAIHQALKEDLIQRGTAKIGEDTEYKKISDLNLTISDDVIEDIKVQLLFPCLNFVSYYTFLFIPCNLSI
jgi:hypothetical protein